MNQIDFFYFSMPPKIEEIEHAQTTITRLAERQGFKHLAATMLQSMERQLNELTVQCNEQGYSHEAGKIADLAMLANCSFHALVESV